MSKINTFVIPKAKSPLRSVTRELNSRFILPYVCKIKNIHYVDDTYQLLARMSLPDYANVLLAPNHPEFFTDWMIDKAILDTFKPLAASWADRSIVNGMGPALQSFWLHNNIIAAGSKAPEGQLSPKEYSTQQVLAGNGVLLHPEGGVSWSTSIVHPMFQGLAEMAISAAKQSNKPVYIVPLAWYLKITTDLSHAYHAIGCEAVNMLIAQGYASKKDRATLTATPEAWQNALMQFFYSYGRAVAKSAFEVNCEHDGFHRNQAIALLKQAGCVDDTIKQPEVIVRQAKANVTSGELTFLKMLLKMPELPTSAWSVQEWAYFVKLLRQELPKKSWKDSLNRYIPIPVTSRDAYVSAQAFIEVHGTESPESISIELQKRCQQALDIARERANI